MKSSNSNRSTQHGGALVSVLAFVVVTAIIMAGATRLIGSQMRRVQVDADYAASMYVAEAGVNYELHKLTGSVASADTAPFTVTNPFGVANTSFTVQCLNRGTNTPWSGPGTSLDILCNGKRFGTTRSLRVSSKSYGAGGLYALYGVSTSSINGTASSVTGDVGTNGPMLFNGHPTVNGNVTFNGPNARWSSPPNGTYTTVTNAAALVWPTVESIATTNFPSGGLVWLSTHNDNALAVPAVVSNSVSLNGNGTITFKGKSGGSNYYLTSLLMNGNASVAFNNTAGPITIWMGPSGASSTFAFNGGASAIKNSADQTKQVRIYSALSSDMTLNGNSRLDASVYNVNASALGKVVISGTPDIYGGVIANYFTLNGNPTITYQSGYFNPGSGLGYFGFDSSWIELNKVY